MSLSASLLQKINTAMDPLFQITWNRILSWKFGKWCKFSSHVKVKSCRMVSRETRPHVQVISHLFHSHSKCFTIDTTGKIFFPLMLFRYNHLGDFLFCHAALSRNTSLKNWILLGQLSQLRNMVTRQTIKYNSKHYNATLSHCIHTISELIWCVLVHALSW
jgi:hypothetical protein